MMTHPVLEWSRLNGKTRGQSHQPWFRFDGISLTISRVDSAQVELSIRVRFLAGIGAVILAAAQILAENPV